MAKQLNVNLGFTADISQAKMQIMDLQNSLNSLVQGSIASKNLPITKELTEAQSAAAALKVALDSAINTKTGKLDLSRFSESINKSGLDLKTLQGHLQALGPAGIQTFQSLASSIMQAEIPLTRSNMLVSQLWTTLKNTARWQLSSSMMHGFMGTIQGAVGYAKDLNESLNNIRIVTGASVEEMARFAERANRSAKALNATTTEYTNASLIYYQQGLSADEVQKRTDVTIKMANVSRQSAETVSEQLTAVWNNFYDGSQSLESFADKMVALGAATASSSDEIAGGLERFAAIGDTIGLSFDYAASALATITANTRQSEEVVGTALKTIFARIQGLKMGETLEDGLELNKYSEALQTVGISIFEQNGELKNMDNILDEMGSKWETLTKAQQVALAQTVAGVRQYNQLISLMDNWNNGDNDSFQANLDTTRNADGALQKQADIYAESWEAARDRVKTSAQDIYDSLLNDDFFISLLDGFAGLLDMIGTFADSIGGLQGVLSLVGVIMTKVFGAQMAESIERLAYNVKSLTGANQQAAQSMKQEAYDLASKMNYDDGTETGAAQAQAMKSQLDLQNQLISSSANMTEQERKRYQLLLDTNKAYGEQAILAAKVADEAQKAVQNSNRNLRREAIRSGENVEDYNYARGIMKEQAKKSVSSDIKVKDISKQLNENGITNYTNAIEMLNKELNNFSKNNATANAIRKLNSEFKNTVTSVKDPTKAIEDYKKALADLVQGTDLIDDTVMDMSDDFRTLIPSLEDASTEVDQMAQEEIDAIIANNNLNDSMNNLNQNTSNVKTAIAGFKNAMSSYATTIVSAFNGISQLSMGLSSLKSAWDTLNNADMSFGEKVLSVIMSLSMGIPSLIMGWKALTVVQKGHTKSVLDEIKAGTVQIAQSAAKVVSKGAEAVSTYFLKKAEDAETGSVWANTAAWLANPIMWIALIIIGVVAAVTALVVGIWALSNALTSEEQEAKKAAQTAEELSAAYNECASAYQEMIDTISEYEEARKSLDQLVEGTDEYKEALQEANRAALELIQNNPGKFEAGKDYNWVGDKLVLNEDAMKRAKSDGQKQLTTIYGAKQIGTAKADIAQAKVDTTKAAEDIWQNVDTYYNEKSVYEDLFEQANELYKQNQNLYSNKDYMAEQLGLDNSVLADQELIDALWENKNQMIELGNATKAAADSYTLATEAAVRELLGENEDVQESENKEEIITKSKYNFDKEYQNEMDKLNRWGKDGIGKIDTVNNKVEEVWKEYTDAAGLEGTEVIDTTGNDDNRVFVYTDSEGNEKKVGLDTMKEVVATFRANKTVDASATQMAESVEKLNNIIKENRGTGNKDKEAKADATEAAKNFALNDNFNKSSKGDLKDLKAAKDAAGGTEAYLDQLFGDGKDGKISDQTAKNFGYNSAQAMVDAFNQKLEEAEKNWEALKPPGDILVPEDVDMEAMIKMTNQYNEIAQGGTEANLDKIFGDGKDGKISDDTAKKYGYDSAQAMIDAFNEAIANGTSGDLIDRLIGDGKDGQISDETAKKYGYDSAQIMMNAFNEGFTNESMADAFSQNINTILSTIDPSKQAAALEALANIDWSSWDASQQAIEALDAIGAGSETTTEAINLLEDSMRELNGAGKNLNDLKTALDEDIDTEEYETLTQHLKSVAKESKELSKDLAYNEKAAKKVSEAILRFDNAIQDVNDNYEDWAYTLKSGSLQDQAKVAEQLGDAYADMLDIDIGSLSNDFIMNANNLELMKQAANGSEEAYKKLQAAAAEDILMQCGVTMDDTEFWNKKAALDAQLAGLNFQDLEIGASLNDAAALQAMTDLVNAAGMTAQQATDYLASMGVDAEIETVETEEPVERTVNNLTPKIDYKDASIPVVAGDGTVENQSVKVPQILYEANGQKITDTVAGGGVALKVTSATKSSGGNFKFKNSSHGGGVNGPNGPKNSGGGGGGSNKPSKPTKAKTVEPTEKKEKDDEIERYKEITEVLDDLNNELDEIGKLKDEAWGPNKLKAMDQEIAKLKQLSKAQQQYSDEIQSKLVGDKAAVEALGGTFDEFGRLTNYEELMGGLVDSWNSTQAALDTREQAYENSVAAVANTEYGEGQEQQQWAAEDANDAEKEAIDKARDNADKAYENNKKAIEQYMETLNLSEEAQRQLNDYLRQMRQLNYEKLEYKIEFRVEINENDIADIEHQLERLEDNNVYASAERIALIERNAVSYRNIADIQMEAIKEAERLYAADKISRENYMARLQESKEALQEAEISIRDGIKQIGEELSNTFDLVDEKLDQQFTKFDQMIELMEHYKNVVSLTQGEASYKEFNKILKASQEVLRDRITADESEIVMWKARREQLDANMKGMDKNSPEYLAAEEALNSIMEKEADAKSQLMNDIEQLGEYAREIFENSIEQAMKDFEDEMFGRPLNSIIESIEMMNSRQEELLTTTNKIYETNKLIRNVEKDIEATTNNRAKQAYLEFQNKVKQKQEQNELTKFELDLLTAEYEITKAQIALEEAQDAKDTVRLTRDAEGNYGYVYTANQDKISEAEQELDNATNNYYNTALEGAQKYQDQIYQHIQEWEEKVKEVYLDQTLSEEEKNKKIKEINDAYNTLITQDKNLYYMAIGAMQEESYNNQVDYDLKGIDSAENWFTECYGFLSDLEDAQDEYDRNTEEVADHTKENFDEMSTAIDSTKTASQQLVEDMTKSGGIIDTCNNELKDSIDNATEAWWKYIEALQEVIRLTDEAMKKNHDTQLKEGYKDDYAAEISKRLANNAKYSDYDIQQLLQYRWEKMGGVDNTDYQALINAGGTSEQIALWEVLRRFKIEQTDWSASDLSYADKMRENKLDQDYAQLIIDYLTSNLYGRWSDSQVQKYLREREIKIKERNMQGQVMSNQELKDYIAKQVEKKPEELFTGGYTGSWGPEGKLAVLHEKELVLNAQDTENFLSATNILREISQMLDNNALVASLGMINLRAMTIDSPADQILQQEVAIHADFPNVTDHNEIEMAIDNLINAASQYAYRK